MPEDVTEVVPADDKTDEELLVEEVPEEKEEEKKEEEKKEEAKEEEEEEEEEELELGPRRPSFKEIKEKYPDFFKTFPELREAFFRESEYTKIFPTVEDAKEALEDL